MLKGFDMTSDLPAGSLAITVDGRPHKLKFLHPEQIIMIDEALCALGSFGEVRLILEKNRLRFIVTQKSHDALRWQPGTLTRDVRGDEGR